METSLITGVAGQDGSYLAEQLLAQGRRVIGTVRPGQAGRELPGGLGGRIQVLEWDLSDPRGMAEILEETRPDSLFHFAGRSSGAGMFDHMALIGDQNGVAVARILESIALLSPGTRFCLASSSEMFGNAVTAPQAEDSPFRPRSPYGAAKVFAHSVVRNARERNGLFACSAILYNHESPRRGLDFVTRKISHGVASIKAGFQAELVLGNLSARRDWGYAPDYVRAMSLMVEQPKADDYVIATGKSHSVLDFCRVAFEHVGLDYRNFVREQEGDFRPSEQVPLVGDASRARETLRWAPEVAFEELVHRMVDADLQRLHESN